MLSDGTIAPSDLYWKEGMTDWLELSTTFSATISPANTNKFNPTSLPEAPLNYANCGRRLVAAIVDNIIMQVIVRIIAFIAIRAFPTNLNAALTFGVLIVMIAFAVYYSYFESPKQQATWGKQLMGIVVTDEHGQRISFGRAFIRHLVRLLPIFISFIALLSALFIALLMAKPTFTVVCAFLIATALLTPFISFLMCLFTNKKQCLHDKIARSLVLKKNNR